MHPIGQNKRCQLFLLPDRHSNHDVCPLRCNNSVLWSSLPWKSLHSLLLDRRVTPGRYQEVWRPFSLPFIFWLQKLSQHSLPKIIGDGGVVPPPRGLHLGFLGLCADLKGKGTPTLTYFVAFLRSLQCLAPLPIYPSRDGILVSWMGGYPLLLTGAPDPYPRFPTRDSVSSSAF